MKSLFEEVANGNKKILTELYYGEIVPYERGLVDNPEYVAISEKIRVEMEFFTSLVDEEHRERLDGLENLFDELCAICEADAFSYGFKLASFLYLEVFA